MFRRILSGAYSTFQSKQPIQWTGAVRHVGRWLTTDIVGQQASFQNPQFKEISTVISVETTESKEVRPSKTNSITLYCIHGTADRFGAFSQVAERLVKDLPEQIKCVQLNSFEKRGRGLSVEAYAQQLVDQILKNKETDVVLMGHSRGVLVIESAISALEKAGIKVHGIISVAGPYGGSWLAMKPFTFFSDSVAEMQPGSKFILKIREQVKQSSIPRFYYAAQNDSIISLDSAVIPEHKDRVVVLSSHGHLSILSSRRLAEKIRGNLKTVMTKTQSTAQSTTTEQAPITESLVTTSSSTDAAMITQESRSKDSGTHESATGAKNTSENEEAIDFEILTPKKYIIR